MFPTSLSQSNDLTLEEVISRLIDAPMVRGIALFGSSQGEMDNPVSDYDLLIVLAEPPVKIFQMQTYINGRIADVAFVESEVVERVLAMENPVSATSPEGFLIGWLEGAKIVYDPQPQHLREIQKKLKVRDWRKASPTVSDLYGEWFWLNFDLRHMQRMVVSADPIHLMTVDLRLMACVSQICRTYCRVRGIHWRGEKAALRYLQEKDRAVFALIERFLSEPSRDEKVRLCAAIIGQVLRDAGGLWPDNASAIYLKNSADHPNGVQNALDFWERLLTKHSLVPVVER